MKDQSFTVIGENIHCTRIVKSGGTRTSPLPGGGEGLSFAYDGEDCLLPIPQNWAEISPPYESGKIRHIALAVYQSLSGGSEDERAAGEKYLCWAAERQISRDAKYLDVNVDEYTNDLRERIETMSWLAGFLAGRYETPLSIDSSNVDVIAAGLAQCRKDVSQMVNSVSLEREEAVDVIIEFGADAVVSAAGKTGLPNTTGERLANFDSIVKILDAKGMKREKMYLDPLVLPISVDSGNGKKFFESVTAVRERYDGVHITGGLSNVSYGMPNRKLLNMVFTRLFVDAGGDSGIIDPVQMPVKEIAAMDVTSNSFKLAQAVLDGTDFFGGEYIAAYRDGRLQ
ncbi:MAG: dihydropteroate synthase [Spirochaetales bacterium]|nr:dihydropteroate synthase [Spirochaetales bacterium]